ncbi:MAG: hypothetical protein A2Y62_05375 [Candidatus Fischerbacteria bacterium RBG_13_37_8]|uniref:Type II secretion system protein GspG C-terminal domain-containing protein n=1 Tax=Candidatus Fischerbacteria bacterium RBG_13_37_8 TaxID=1817863 RepID=A0A1F5VXZ0_9BACT|nr:MAG: hypothetical protein A2Y62_05375 [Candidatus Fischerbacteria bacterium RBG_13_37_8]
MMLLYCKDRPEKAYEQHLVQGIQRNFEIKTRSDMLTLKNAIQDYIYKEGNYPQANNMFELMRLLRPKYTSEAIFYDAWNQEFIVKSSTTHIEIISKGIDQQLNTRDDLKMAM